MTRIGLTALPLLLLAAAVLVFLGGCDDPTAPCEPEVPAGRILGYVRTGGLPMEAVISAERIIVGTEATYEAEPDDTGFYILDLPAGIYTVSLNIGGYRYYDYAIPDLGYGQVPPDTVRIDHDHSPFVIDFDLGGLTMQVDLSDRLDGERGEVVIHRRDDSDPGWRSYVNIESKEIVDGHFEIQIPGILPGDYQVEIILGRRQYMCYCPYDGEHIWMPGTNDPAESPWYEIAADSVVDLTCELAADPARIEGRVIGAWQDMGLRDGPEISLSTPDSLRVMGLRRILEDDGSFSIDLHLPGPVKLQVSQNGVGQWVGGPGFDEATVFDLQSGQTISDIEFVQSGLRLDIGASSMPSTYTEFHFYDPLDLSLVSVADIEFFGGEYISIPNLWPGDYLMYVTPAEWQVLEAWWIPQWFDRADAPEQAQIISIESEEITTLELVLEQGGTIGGTFERTTDPEQSFYVVVTPADENLCVRYDYVFASNSDYSISGLVDGDYKVGAYPIGQGWSRYDPLPEGTIWYPGTLDRESASVVEILDGGTVAGVDFVIP
ncbi:hypothetical protein H8E07_16665 [bacterium]|nr:hypothetical protein [bacterium]